MGRSAAGSVDQRRYRGTVAPDRTITPFGAKATAVDVIAGIDLSGKRAVVTGASSGIGVETARALADAGAIVAARLWHVSVEMLADRTG